MKKLQNFKNLKRVIFFSIVALAACTTVSRAQMVLISANSTVNDGGFDDGASTFAAYFAGGYPTYENIGSTGVTSQTAASGTLEWSVTNGYNSTQGGFVADATNQTPSISFLENGAGRTITSESNLNYDVSTGDVFTLSAYIADNTTGDTLTLTPTISIGGDSDSLTGNGTSSGVANQFTLVTFTYTVPFGEDGDTLNNVSFSTSGSAQNYIDSVSLTVTPVGTPEPSTYALAAFGLGALVLVARRRRSMA